MKKSPLLFILLFFCTFVSAQLEYGRVNWISLDQARAMQKMEYKPILVKVFTNWDKPSLTLAFSCEHEVVADFINRNYYPVSFDAESGEKIRFAGKTYENPDFDPSLGKRTKNSVHELTKHWGVNSFPRVLILNENLEVTNRICGGRQPADLFARLRGSAYTFDTK